MVGRVYSLIERIIMDEKTLQIKNNQAKKRRPDTVQSISEILPQIPILVKPSKCEQCDKRPRFEKRKWCKVCIEGYRIKEAGTIHEIIKKTIPKMYQTARLQDLSEELQQEYLKLPGWQGLYLWGAEGRGKTHTAAAFAISYLQEGFSVVYTNYDLLCSWIRSTYQAKAKETEYDIIKRLTKPDKLFIDDVGVTVSRENQESDFSLRIFYSIIDKRLINYKPTFITTNKSIEGISKSFDRRISSRLQQCCKIRQLKGEDKRL